jgi:3-phenylpropionate/trans-cinnamate dioxygenase ferredoxin reductase subunit
MSAGGEQPLAGPDFAAGVALDQIPDGGMLQGHAGGDAILLVRRGGEVHAVGATCTHYSGPLGEGLVVGDQIRCPWHHACFDLRTGEAFGAPALNPIPCWRVEQQGGRVRVLDKKTAPLERTSPAAGPSSVGIVGAGAAGNALAEALRREGYLGPITMLGLEPPVDRPNLSKDYLAGTAPEEWLPLRGPDFYAEHRIELRAGARAVALDAGTRTVKLDGGGALPFDAVVLATGAEPAQLAIPGAERVRYLRTLADSRAIIAAAKDAKRAVVIGASFIGLEVAASLRARGLSVDVVAPGEHPLARVLGAALGGFVRALHEAEGVRFHLGEKPAAIDARAVTLSGGATLAADLIVAGVGVRPATALAESAGLTIDRGVVTDEFFETSARGIYAVGDLARYREARSGRVLRVEHWVAAERQGQALARNLVGRRAPYAVPPFFWSQHYDVRLDYVGHAERVDDVRVAGSLERRDFLAAFREGGRITAVAAVGRDRACLEAEAALERDDQAALEALVR